MEKLFKQNIQSKHLNYKKVVKQLYDNPEIGNQEFESSKLLVELIKENDFETTYPYICPTGFKGEYKAVKEGPTVAFLCEFDALPVVGHGCGHNLIGVMSIAAATALKEVIDEIGGTIYIYGTPAEENFGGKVSFTENHAFDNVDLALMIHPGTRNGIGGRTNALMPLKFEFFGKSAHGANPYDGYSALDAAVSTYTGISMLRQYARPGSTIHGVIKDGGEAANVIPEYASLEYYFRNEKMEYAKYLSQRATKIAEGAALQAQVDLKVSVYECPYDDKKINYTLANKLKEIYTEIGLEDIQDVVETPSGSSDIGSVSYVCPIVEGRIKIADETVLGHSKEFADATISKLGDEAIINGGCALAILAYEFITDSEFKNEVVKEFNNEN